VYIYSVVDDMLITSSDAQLTQSIVNAILAKLPGKDLGQAQHFNGMKIVWQPATHSVILCQPSHVQGLVDDFLANVDSSYGKYIPCVPGIRFCKEGHNEALGSPDLVTEDFPYRKLIGGLNYLSCSTRPDITFIVNQLARYSNAPKVAHWDAAIAVLKYLKNTINWGISLGHGAVTDKVYFKHLPPAVAYSDANHGTGLDDKKSVTGMVIHVLGGPVSWCSKMQKVASTSTCESEYRAMSATAREALWLAKLLPLFGVPAKPFQIRGDNKGAIQSIMNHTHTKHTKHIEIHHEFMKDRVVQGDLEFEHIPGKKNPADLFTKALPRVQFEEFRLAIGMRMNANN